MENEQLRREAAMKRIPVSQAVEDIKVTNDAPVHLLLCIIRNYKNTTEVCTVGIRITDIQLQNHLNTRLKNSKRI